jgi:hypothetical protein
LRGEAISESFAVQVQNIDSKTASFRFRQNEIMAGFLFENSDAMLKVMSSFKKNEKEVAGIFPAEFSYIWSGLCSFYLFLKTGKRRYRQEGYQASRKVDHWANSGTIIYSAPSLLLQAYQALCLKKLHGEQIEQKFRIAIVACRGAKCTLFEALATELLAKYFLRENPKCRKGLQYLESAIQIYKNWGTLTKATHLAEEMGLPSRVIFPSCEL